MDLVQLTKPLALIPKLSYSNSLFETPLSNLKATPLLSFKYRQTYLNTSASNRTHKKLRKKKKTERNETHAIK